MLWRHLLVLTDLLARLTYELFDAGRGTRLGDSCHEVVERGCALCIALREAADDAQNSIDTQLPRPLIGRDIEISEQDERAE